MSGGHREPRMTEVALRDKSQIRLAPPKKTASFDRNLSFSVLFALRRVVLLRSFIVLRTVLFALQVHWRIKYH